MKNKERIIFFKDEEICHKCYYFGCKFCGSCDNFSHILILAKDAQSLIHRMVISSQIIDKVKCINSKAANYDNVNHPAHYAGHGGVECIEAIRASMSAEAFAGYCKGNVLKYLWRYTEKGGAEDLEKAKWYLNKLIEISGPAAPAEQVSPDHNHECDVIAAAGQINLCSPSDKGKNDNG